jgi:hypothetical protein
VSRPAEVATRLRAQLLTPPALVGPLLVAVGAAASCAVLAVHDPADGDYPTCPTRALTGLDCPGCGALRGMHRLLSGDVFGALGYNALMVLALPFLVAAYLVWALRSAGVDVNVSAAARRVPAGAVLVTVLLFTVARNLPVPGLRALGS